MNFGETNELPFAKASQTSFKTHWFKFYKLDKDAYRKVQRKVSIHPVTVKWAIAVKERDRESNSNKKKKAKKPLITSILT